MRFPVSQACIAALMSLLSGCGGGGGGGGSSAGTPPAPETVALVISAANADDAVGLPASAGAATLQLAELVADFERRTASKASTSFSDTCANGGTADVVLTDPDQNRKPTAGDSLRVTLRNCYASAIDDTATGEFTVTLEAPAAGANEAYVGTATFTSGFLVGVAGAAERIEINGSLRADWRSEALQTITRVAGSAQDDLQFVVSTTTARVIERLRSPQLSKTLRYDLARALTRMNFSYESQALRGQVTFSTPEDLSSYFNVYADQGRLLATGAGSRVAELSAGAFLSVPAGTATARLRVDTDGNGSMDVDTTSSWTDVTDGYLWWEPVSMPDIRTTTYRTQTLAQSSFGFLFIRPLSPIAVGDAISIQLTRPLVNGTALQFLLRNTAGGAQPTVPVTTTVNGAHIDIVPSRQLDHGASYVLDMTSGSLRDASGAFLQFLLTPFQTRNNLVAAGSASVVLAFAGSPFTLSAAASSATSGTIQSYRWRQVAGTTATIANANTSLATVTPVAPSGAGDLLRFELTVTNDAGESDSTTLDVQSFASASQATFIYYRSTPGDNVANGATVLVSPGSGDIVAERNTANGISVQYGSFAAGPLGVNTHIGIDFAAPNGAPLAAGAYENARRYLGSPQAVPGLTMSVFPGGGCNEVAGRFDILEIEYDGSGGVTKLAVDFEHHCELLGPPLFGSVRFHSALPLRP